MTAFSAADLLAAYASGVFPMGEARDDPRVFLVEPERRAIFPLDGLRVSSRLRRTVRRDAFEVRADTAFVEVLHACAAPGRGPDREDTWINAPIRALYLELHRLGHAHSIECWRDGALVGGLYGVTLGGAFFGESMFSRATDASKVALVHLVARLRRGGWALLDAQFMTDHLARLGAIEISQADYLDRLHQARRLTPDRTSLTAPTSGAEALARLSI
ncbi:leucyl/phenylalanyl-tRNA--protein transferase [Brevundimonas balnearis]|uniref:Leucyl/phenylalanyl-tRNA--protein transferase n=1 Tax=Brevundimonas balnearis TaxID=1572858 RepID=A0ABV6QYL5_9CAUL